MSLEEITRSAHSQLKEIFGDENLAVAMVVIKQGEDPNTDSLAVHSVGFEDQTVLGATLGIIGQQMLQADANAEGEENA